ncbi:hypothetical protein BJ912DRAFT_698070 [Pholiota molesta]|nr:hypothetical protein BJ912DRAFT_698070 [Pholiota molesta]
MNVLRRQIKFAPPPSTWSGEDDHFNGTSTGNDNPLANGNGKTPRTKSIPPTRQLTQQEQNEGDVQKRREALRDLIESWMDRLQLISVITTFFASTEATMFSISVPDTDDAPISITAQVANIGIVGALVVHSSAAIISFLAAFFLIRYKLKVADNEEREAEKAEKEYDSKNIVESPTSMGSFSNHSTADKDQEKAEKFSISRTSRSTRLRKSQPCPIEQDTDPIPGRIRIPSGSTQRPIWSSNPHLVQVGPFQNHPPTHLLHRCHALCVALTTIGFVLAIMGILCLAWTRLPLSVSISASCFMALCSFSGIFILLEPYPPEGTSPNIYVFDEF